MSELKYLLESKLAAVAEIQRLLALEAKCLLEGDEKDISQLVRDKQQALDVLAEVAQRLEKFLAREGLTADRAGLSRHIERAPDRDELAHFRNRITDELRFCAELNRMNGAVLECSRAASERALRVLLSPHREPDCYRATGRLENIGSRHSIGKA